MGKNGRVLQANLISTSPLSDWATRRSQTTRIRAWSTYAVIAHGLSGGRNPHTIGGTGHDRVPPPRNLSTDSDILMDVTDQLDGSNAFSEFYAVVLRHKMGAGRRVRWSASHRAWLRSREYGRYMDDPWLDKPGETYGEPDAPSEHHLAGAASVVNDVINPVSGSCAMLPVPPALGRLLQLSRLPDAINE